MGSHNKSSRTKANSKTTKAGNCKEQAKTNPKGHRLKLVLIIVAALLVVVAVCIGVISIIRDGSQANNFSVEEFEGKTYYVAHGNYGGRYDIQYTDLYPEFSGESHENDEWQNFNTKAVMNYDEYVSFCDKWHLQQTYSDQQKRYLVVAQVTPSAVSVEAVLAGVEYDGDTARLYVADDSYGVTADMVAYVIVVPTDDDGVQNVEVVDTLSEDCWQEVIDPNAESQTTPLDMKPIIYLYPQSDTDVRVVLGKPNDLTVSYPLYNAQTGWHVLAKPSGELIDLQGGRSLYALYYESDLSESGFKVEKDGFVVKRENAASFLEDKLARLGLNEREAEEFIIYWLPKLSEHEYNYIRFADADEINRTMPLSIEPVPDTTIRILMIYKGLNEPLTGSVEQQLPETAVRNGFTVVEWGGSEIMG